MSLLDRVAELRATYPLWQAFAGLVVSTGPDRYKVLCPFHEDERQSCQVKRWNGAWLWRCFVCNDGGDVVDLVMRRERVNMRRAVEILDGSGTQGDPAAAVRPRGHRSPVEELVLVCDACRGETAVVKAKTYRTVGKHGHEYDVSAYGEALASGWEIGAEGVACVGPRCLEAA